MNKLIKNATGISKLVIVAVLIAVIVVGAAGAYYLSTQGSAQTNPETTQTPTNTESPITTTTPTSTEAPTTSTPAPSTSTNVASASSLKYKVSLTENGQVQGTYTYQGKNSGTTNFMLRIDSHDAESEQAFLFSGAEKKAWAYENNQWTDISPSYDMQFAMWNNLWIAYNNNLAAWAGTGSYSYTQDGSTVTIFDIQVNPVLDDSLFTH
jgi:cytoskeletal protein RodZ